MVSITDIRRRKDTYPCPFVSDRRKAGRTEDAIEKSSVSPTIKWRRVWSNRTAGRKSVGVTARNGQLPIEGEERVNLPEVPSTRIDGQVQHLSAAYQNQQLFRISGRMIITMGSWTMTIY